MIRALDEHRLLLNIRPAQRSDLAALLRLENTCFETDRLSRRSLLRFTRPGRDATQSHLLLVAEADDREEVIADCLLLGRRQNTDAWYPTGRLYSLVVAPEYRGQQIALRLMHAVLTAAANRQMQRVRLEVDPANAQALALYRSLGFEQVDTLPGYYQNGRPALRLERALQPERSFTPNPTAHD